MAKYELFQEPKVTPNGAGWTTILVRARHLLAIAWKDNGKVGWAGADGMDLPHHTAHHALKARPNRFSLGRLFGGGGQRRMCKGATSRNRIILLSSLNIYMFYNYFDYLSY
jgi:hypothetical protein